MSENCKEEEETFSTALPFVVLCVFTRSVSLVPPSSSRDPFQTVLLLLVTASLSIDIYEKRTHLSAKQGPSYSHIPVLIFPA